MADKPEFVDMISEATRQKRRVMPRVIEAAPSKETSRLGHRPARLLQWRLENLTPWKIKPWEHKDWD